MSDRPIQLRIALAETQAEYIRHVRARTLEAIGAHVHPAHVQPLPYAVYLFAWDIRDDKPAGLAEACFLEQHYESYEQAPYSPHFDLGAICPFSQLASIRTVFVEPDYRLQRGLYMKLILGAAYIFRSLGALYSVATTSASDEGLARLYLKTGGGRVTTFELEELHRNAIALYLFDLDALCRHAGMRRTLKDLRLDEGLLGIVRARSAWTNVNDNRAARCGLSGRV